MQVYTDVNRTLQRDAHGVVHIEASSLADCYWGMGYAHALDRGLQMLLMRILGQGRAAEILDGGDETVLIDRFFRRMHFGADVEAEDAKLTPEARALCVSYCAGVNECLSTHKPWELTLLMRYRPEAWTIADSLTMSRMAGYLTLAQSQGEMERLLVQMVQADLPAEQLEELFPGVGAELDVDLLQKVKLGERIVPEAVTFGSGAPRMMASNNWVVSGQKTKSKSPMLANDPHLEINRLPAVWYEVVLKTKERWGIFATMPGLPGPLLGRTSDLAWGVTYTFLDAIDSWVEHCKDKKYRRGESWVAFSEREEIIKRKGRAPEKMLFYENDHGVLDGDPSQEGYYLSTRWSSDRSGAQSLNHMSQIWSAQTVSEGMEHLGQIESSFSWVLADRQGNIGFQMSGLMPKRREGMSGLVPQPGWDERNDWQGFVDPTDLPRCLNPEEGFFVTANQDLNAYGKAQRPLNLFMGDYRAVRITEVLAEKDNLTCEDMCRLQNDLYSHQAKRFMAIAKPLLPDSPTGRLLGSWNFEYDLSSLGAPLFERFYRVLRRRVFGSLGAEVVDFLSEESGIFTDFYINFDRVLLSESSAWFGEKSREEHYAEALEEAVREAPRPWQEEQQFVQSHMLFAGKLPRFLGFDRGPFSMAGGRATVHQGQIYRSAGRATSFAPSLRFVTDLSQDSCQTCLAGGVSDRRFSKLFCSEMDAWAEGRYKKVRP